MEKFCLFIILLFSITIGIYLSNYNRCLQCGGRHYDAKTGELSVQKIPNISFKELYKKRRFITSGVCVMEGKVRVFLTENRAYHISMGFKELYRRINTAAYKKGQSYFINSEYIIGCQRFSNSKNVVFYLYESESVLVDKNMVSDIKNAADQHSKFCSPKCCK